MAAIFTLGENKINPVNTKAHQNVGFSFNEFSTDLFHYNFIWAHAYIMDNHYGMLRKR